MNSHNPLVHAVTASGRLLAHVKARSDSPAVLVDDAVVSWRDLDDASRRVPTRGLAKGDRAAVFADNSLDVIVALLAHHRRGVVHVPINPGYQGAEREHVVADSGAKVVLTSTELAEREPSDAKLRDDDDDDDDDTCLLIYTSGTTGKSKGCELTVKNVVAAVSSLASLWEITSDDEIVHALPLFHVHGLCVALHGALLQGARTRLLKRFTPEGVVDGVARGGTVFMGVPTMYRRLLDHLAKSPRDADVLARARLFTAGSAPLPADDLEEFARRTGHRIVERYGMSETLITLSNPLHGARKAGTVGKPVPGVRCAWPRSSKTTMSSATATTTISLSCASRDQG